MSHCPSHPWVDDEVAVEGCCPKCGQKVQPDKKK
jgi:hypothetical protein